MPPAFLSWLAFAVITLIFRFTPLSTGAQNHLLNWYGSSGSRPWPPVAIPPGGKFTVTVHTRGCFGESAYRFDLCRSPGPTFRAFKLRPVRREGRLSYHVGDTVIERRLTPRDLDVLGSALSYYQVERAGSCTLVDTVTFEFWDESKLRSREIYVDASCSWMETGVSPLLHAYIDEARAAEQP